MNDNSYSEKNTLVCCALVLTLGFVGVHKFYVGRARAGLVHILSSVFLIGFLIVFYDLFMIVTGRFEDKEGKILKAIPVKGVSEISEENIEGNDKHIQESESVDPEIVGDLSITDQEEVEESVLINTLKSLSIEEAKLLLYGLLASVGDGELSEGELVKLKELVFDSPDFLSFSQKMGFELTWNRHIAFQQYILLILNSIEGDGTATLGEDLKEQIKALLAGLKDESIKIEDKEAFVEELKSIPQREFSFEYEEGSLTPKEQSFISLVENELGLQKHAVVGTLFLLVLMGLLGFGVYYFWDLFF